MFLARSKLPFRDLHVHQASSFQAAPISIKTHSHDPVPFAIMGKGIEPDDVQRFDEEAARRGGYGTVEATRLVGMMTRGKSQQEPLGRSR